MDVVSGPTSRTSIDAVGPIAVNDPSTVGEARRAAERVARAMRLSEEDSGRLAIVVTEIATNQMKHANGGTIFLHPLPGGETHGAMVVGVDEGPGMDLQRAMRDGHSSAGTAGNGLGAIRRMSDAIDIHSTPGRGTVVMARIGGTPMSDFGAAVPLAGEEMCGDAWAVSHSGGHRTVLVVDGLGHGPQAAEAARTAVEGFFKQPAAPLEMILRVLDGLLRSTRGVAASVARVDPRNGSLRYAGVGNITGILIDGVTHRNLISHNGTLGHQARKFQEFQYPWAAGNLLVLHSDGLTTQWKIDDQPGLRMRDPAVIASVLVRDFSRGRDDASAFVLAHAEAQS